MLQRAVHFACLTIMEGIILFTSFIESWNRLQHIHSTSTCMWTTFTEIRCNDAYSLHRLIWI